jgi:hypothetical protein
MLPKAYIGFRLFIARVAWLCLAVVVALFRGNSLTPNLTTWRDEQWQELHAWAVNPTAAENINLKYCVPSSLLIASGALLRVFTSNLVFICACGLVSWVLSVGVTRWYVQEKRALGAEIEFGPKGFLVYWAIWFGPLYAFLVFLTGALITTRS